MLSKPVLLAVTWLLASTAPALAQDADPPVPDASEATEAPLPESVRTATEAWLEAWKATPALVALNDVSKTADLREGLELRLKVLGEKTFSNREWKTYWERQAETAGALAEALRTSGAPAARAEALDAWVALAREKSTNQDAFFAAIESERDAVEDRLEASLDAEATEAAPTTPPLEEPNPWEARRLHLDDLERQIRDQESRKAQIRAETTFVERQLATEDLLLQALSKDLELAERELALAEDQAAGTDAWAALWSPIAERTAPKVEKIAAEAEYGSSRKRAREVELGLAQSKLTFRDERLATLRADYDAAASLGTWLEAGLDTFVGWLRAEAWRVVLGLLVLYFVVRMVLRLNTRLVKELLARTDDNPDVEDDSDQRRQTLADVYSSVSRIVIYIVGGLVALEQIGVNTGPLMGSVAILGLAVSFGSQNLVRDVVNGFFILLENQYAVGDVVEIGGKTGTVSRISIRSTWIRAGSGDLHIVPNGSISLVSNLTRDYSTAACEVGVGYGADLDLVERVANEVGEKMYEEEAWREVLHAAPKWLGVTALADSSVNIKVTARVNAGSQWSVSRELNRRLKVAFDQAGIEIPFPQVVVHRAE